MTDKHDPFLVLGKITKAKGLKGEVKVYSYAESPESFKRYGSVFLRKGRYLSQPYQVERLFQQKNTLVIKFKGVNHIDQAEELIGSEICVRKEVLERTAENEYYWYELVGLKVIDDKGEPLGTLTAILPTGANDAYLIEGAGGERLLPAMQDVIQEVDLENGIMVVRLPEVT